jgi:membrane protease YdiL (CAAX protease family)
MRRAGAEAELTPSIAISAWVFAFLAGNIGLLVVVGATSYAGDDSDTWPLWLIAVSFVPLWLGLLGALVVVSRRWGTGSLRRDYGIRLKPVDAAIGIPAGVIAQLVFVKLLYDALSKVVDTDDVSESARSLTDRADGLGIVLLVLVVAIGAPIVEELFFRGLVLRAFGARLGDGVAVVASAVMFGLVHFQLLQFPGLVVFGLLAGYLANRTGRLGASIFAHVGFNATTIVLLLMESSNTLT